jgi:hypothetical protein
MIRRVTISRTERVVILLLASGLLVSLLINLGLTIEDHFRMSEFHARYPNWAVDYPRQSVAALHFLALPVFLAVVFARKYFVSGFLTLAFSMLLLFGLYLKLDGTGALGGEGFYKDVWEEFLAKTYWFEWLANLSLVGLVVWHLKIFTEQFRRVENPHNLP